MTINDAKILKILKRQYTSYTYHIPFCFQSEYQHPLHRMSDYLFLQGLNLGDNKRFE